MDTEVHNNISSSVKTLSPGFLEAIKLGDENAYRQFYIHYWDALCHFLTSLIGIEEDAKEITQDILLQIWENRQQIEPGKNFKAYIYSIARKQAMQYFRHKKVAEKYITLKQQELNEEDVSSDEIIMEKELNILMDITIEKMPKLRKKVLLLQKDENMSIEDIAQALQISKDSVSSHLYKARKELKEVLLFFSTFFSCIIIT